MFSPMPRVLEYSLQSTVVLSAWDCSTLRGGFGQYVFSWFYGFGTRKLFLVCRYIKFNAFFCSKIAELAIR